MTYVDVGGLLDTAKYAVLIFALLSNPKKRKACGSSRFRCKNGRDRRVLYLEALHEKAMKDRRIAVRYASALLSVLTDPAKAEAADGFLLALSRSVDESAELKALMMNPATPHTDLKAVLEPLASAHGMGTEVINFLASLVDHNRTSALQVIAEAFHEAREKALGIVPVKLTTATPLSPELQQRSQKTLEKLTGRTVRLTCNVEPSIIGGAVTTVGSTVYDGSVRKQLDQLRRQMAQE